jgi:hypothetical protein
VPPKRDLLKVEDIWSSIAELFLVDKEDYEQSRGDHSLTQKEERTYG